MQEVKCADGNDTQEEICRDSAFGRVFVGTAEANDPDDLIVYNTSFNPVTGLARNLRAPILLYDRSEFNSEKEVIYLAANDTLELSTFFAVVTPLPEERIQVGAEVFVDARGSDWLGAPCDRLSGGRPEFEVHFTGMQCHRRPSQSI